MNRQDREDAFLRGRRYLGVRHPDAGPDGYERFVTYAATIPVELAEELDRAQRKSLGINASKTNATRANMVRSALRLYLETVDPAAPEPIEATAVDITEPPKGGGKRGLPRARWA